MSQYIDYLLSVAHSPQESVPGHALTDIADLVDLYLSKNPYTAKGIVDLLNSLRSGHPELDLYDRQSVTALLDAVIGMLSDDNSVDALVSKLDRGAPPYFIARLLGWCGPRARSALPTLVELVASSELWKAQSAIRAVLAIGGAETAVLFAIRRAIEKEDDFEFMNLTHLAELASYNNHRGFLELIRLGAQSKNSDVRDVAAYTIGNMNSSSKQQMMDVLERLRNDPDQDVRFSATEAMGNPS